MPESVLQWPPLTGWLAVALALLLMWPAWVAARNGLSDLYAHPAIGYLEGKRFDADTLGEAEWQAIENSLAKADRMMPSNPQYLEALGRLHQLKLTLFSDALSIEETNVHANAAKSYFQEAVESRPTWPYYWGNLALEECRRGNFAADTFSLALVNASRFGPWNNDTQRLVMELGSETWGFLSPDAQREFILNIERGLHRQPANTFRVVRNFGAWPEVCEASNQSVDIALPGIRALCAQVDSAK